LVDTPSDTGHPDVSAQALLMGAIVPADEAQTIALTL
jgi:hypothetical protein